MSTKKELHREPSIHITESALTKILHGLLDDRIGAKRINPLVFDLLSEARKYQLSERKLLASNKKNTQRAENINKSPLEYTMIMAKAIYHVRKSLKHRGIDIAKPGTKDFTIIKDITASALEYVDELKLTGSYDTMFAKYIRSYMSMQGKDAKFNLLALRGKSEQIIAYDKSVHELLSDKNSDKTERAYRKYNQYIIKQTGEILTHYDKMPDKYKCFMEVANRATTIGITVEVWIDAQFSELEWTKSIPEPGQLIGPKAEERLQKYLYKNNIKLRATPDEVDNKEKINKFKNLRKLR